ncbi:hypothetical protein SAMN06893096_107206 [Geodermatophilus pulveris]|uniref:Uncharacterized protein n=1 Tax=Geodermatophilus pulveris TaxID=1564159 RepID=A0A239H5Q7_9ACTN|nr:hypothetical protein [Geodermatophilus pulveris]SNS76358.1 hypothetical protein SAMN06893096_107206 [Geodermatophilus pulveris]
MTTLLHPRTPADDDIVAGPPAEDGPDLRFDAEELHETDEADDDVEGDSLADEIHVEDPAVEARLFTAREVRRAAWHVSPLTLTLILLTVGVALLAATGLPFLPMGAEAEYHSAAAGGLMALAGIVPAVLAAVSAGRPVTRLDGGSLMRRGLAGWVVGIYCVAWGAAFTLPLLTLVHAWPWLEQPAGIGAGLGLLVVTTLGTPIVFLVLAARLHPRTSTLLAVSRAVRRNGQPSAADIRDRCALVKDLRDLAISEHEAGDRRAVRHRMAGLATIAASTPVREVAHLAFDELGLVCQGVCLDRDLAREGVALVRLAAEQLAASDPELLDRAISETAAIWTAVAKRDASPKVAEDAVVAATEIALLRGPAPQQALGALVTVLARADDGSRAWAVDHIRLVDERVDFPALPHDDPVAATWVETRRRLGPDGFLPLVHRLSALLLHGGDRETTALVARAAAHLLLTHNTDPSLTSKSLRDDVQSLVRDGHAPALRRIAAAALKADHPAPDAARGVLFAELLRHWALLSKSQLEAVVRFLVGLPDDRLLDRVAPALLPRLNGLVPPTLLRTWGPDRTVLTVHQQFVVLRLVARVRSAAAHRDPSMADAHPLLNTVFSRLVDAGLVDALTEEHQTALRKLTAALVHQVGEVDPEAAAALAAPAIPLLVAGEGDFGAAWLLWWQREAKGLVPERTTSVWVASAVATLVALRARLAVLDAAAPLNLPAEDPHAGRGWTYGAVAEAASDALVQLQADLPPGTCGVVLSAVRRWVIHREGGGAPSEDVGESQTRVTEALRALPDVPDDDPRAAGIHRHRAALELWQRWVIGRRAGDRGDFRAADEALAVHGQQLLRAKDEISIQVLATVVPTWCEGATGMPDPEDPAVVHLVRALTTFHQVRAEVGKALRLGAVAPAVWEALVPFFSTDVLTLAQLVRQASVEAPALVAVVVGPLLDALADPAVVRKRDRQLPEAARCLADAAGSGAWRAELAPVLATLERLGRRPGATNAARAALAQLGSGTDGTRGGPATAG